MKKIASILSAASLLAVSAVTFAPSAEAAPHAVGAHISDKNGTVFMITKDGTRRPYTSAGAFLSYGFNSWSRVESANSEDIALSVGSYIPPQDGSLICSDRGFDKGTCYIITEGRKAGFVSESAFLGSGYSFNNALYGDVSWMSATTPVAGSHEAHRPGTLINRQGTIQLVIPGGVMGIQDQDTFNSWGYTYAKVVPALPSDASLPQVRLMTIRAPGQLHPLDAAPTALPGYREGWLEGAQGPSESYGTQGYVSGWAYDDGKPVSIIVTLENVNNPSQTVTLQTNTNEVRADVATYLNPKLSRTINNQVGFHAYIPANTAAGTYRIKNATFNGYPFSVRNEVNNTISVGQNHKLRITSPNGGETWVLGSTVQIAWTDVNGDNSPSQTYTVFITRQDGAGTWIAGTATNTKQLTWTVGSYESGGPVPISAKGGYYVQVVKQYAVGEGAWDETDSAFTIQ